MDDRQACKHQPTSAFRVNGLLIRLANTITTCHVSNMLNDIFSAQLHSTNQPTNQPINQSINRHKTTSLYHTHKTKIIRMTLTHTPLVSPFPVYGSIVPLSRFLISSIMIWKSDGKKVWISVMLYLVPLSKESFKILVAAILRARSIQLRTVLALEK